MACRTCATLQGAGTTGGGGARGGRTYMGQRSPSVFHRVGWGYSEVGHRRFEHYPGRMRF